MSTVTETEYTRTEEVDTGAPDAGRPVKKKSGIGGKLGMVALLLLGLFAMFMIYSMFIKAPAPAPAAAPVAAPVVAEPATPADQAPATDPAAAQGDAILGGATPLEATVPVTDPNALPGDPNAAAPETLNGGAPALDPAAQLGATPPNDLVAAAQAAGQATPGQVTDPAAQAAGQAVPQAGFPPAQAAPAQAVPAQAVPAQAVPAQAVPVAQGADAAALAQLGGTTTPAMSADVFAQFRSMLDPIDSRVTTLEGRVNDLAGAVASIQATMANNPTAAAVVQTRPKKRKVAAAPKKMHRVQAPRNQLEVIGSASEGRSSNSSYAVNMPVQPPTTRLLVVEQPVPMQQVQQVPVAVVPAAPVTRAARGSCNIQSIVPGRAWVGLPGGDLAEYSVGNGWTNGARIVEIDPSRGIVTEGGVVVCR